MSKVGLLLDCDAEVAEYLFKNHVRPRMQYDAAYGVMVDGVLSGGILLQSWNGFNVEVSYYGKGTVTAGMLQCIGRILISRFNPSRITVTVSRRARSVIKGLRKLGFVLEGTQRRFYGQQDTNRNTGVRFVMFSERIASIAKLEVPKVRYMQ